MRWNRQLLICILFCMGLPQALGRETASLLEQLTWEQQAERSLLAGSGRGLRFYYHGQKKDCVVILMHGLYQSPRDQIGLAEDLYASGCNVIAPRLPGHWLKEPGGFERTNEEEWSKVLSHYVHRALEWGRRIHLVGHSTGALLNFQYALRFPEQIASNIMLAPAFKLRTQVEWASRWGGALGLDRSWFALSRKTDYDRQPKPLVAGVWVLNLMSQIFGEKLEYNKIYSQYFTPSLVFATENDDVVDTSEIRRMSRKTTAQLIVYSQSSGVFHDNIQRNLKDLEPGDPRAWQNRYIASQSRLITDFIHRLSRQ